MIVVIHGTCVIRIDGTPAFVHNHAQVCQLHECQAERAAEGHLIPTALQLDNMDVAVDERPCSSRLP